MRFLIRPLVATVLLLGLTACAGAGAHGGTDSPVYIGLTATDVTFQGDDGVALHGTVVAPPAVPAAAAPSPAVVLVQGAGPVTRSEYRDEAEGFARRGIAALIYDKRTDGYSATHRDYQQLAGDALSAVRLLKGRSGVDPNQVGVWGLSEGAWVSVLAADRSPDVSFVITAGAVGVTPAQQQAWSYGEFLRHAGVSGSLLPMMQSTGVRQVAGAGLFPEADYDPVPSWEHLRQPVLALWGTLDREAAPEQSSQIIAAALKRGGNTKATIRFIPDARHDLRITHDAGFDRPYGPAPGTADLEAAWVKGQPIGDSTQAAPTQDHATTALSPLHWYENPWGQLAALLLFAAAYAGCPIALVVVNRFRRGDRAALTGPTRRLARLATALGGTTVLGSVVYFFFLVLTATSYIGPVIVGQTIPWLLLHLAALGTIAATCATGVSMRRNRDDIPASLSTRTRLGLLLAAGTVLVPWALYWGLLTF